MAAVTSSAETLGKEMRSSRRERKERKETPCVDCGAMVTRRAARCKTCWAKNKILRVEVPCDQCGKVFLKPPGEIAKAKRLGQKTLLCSIACRTALKTDFVGPLCKVCQSPTGKKTSKYCAECRTTHGWLRRRESKDVSCVMCGGTFKFKSSRAKYCSRNCANEAHSLRMRGEGNSRFTKGQSYGKCFAEMRPLILERDKHTCVRCARPERKYVCYRKDRGSYLRSDMCIHHIDENVQNNAAENLISLCATCHQQNHKSRFPPTECAEFARLASIANQSMTCKWKETVTFLLAQYSFTTAS